MDEIEDAIAEAKEQDGEHFTVKQLEKTRKGLKLRLQKLQAADRKDNVVTFEQLGVPGLPQSAGRNAGTCESSEKRRDVLCRRKARIERTADPINEHRQGFSPLHRGESLAVFLYIGSIALRNNFFGIFPIKSSRLMYISMFFLFPPEKTANWVYNNSS